MCYFLCVVCVVCAFECVFVLGCLCVLFVMYRVMLRVLCLCVRLCVCDLIC